MPTERSTKVEQPRPGTPGPGATNAGTEARSVRTANFHLWTETPILTYETPVAPWLLLLMCKKAPHTSPIAYMAWRLVLQPVIPH